jgi:hypothetical protein
LTLILAWCYHSSALWRPERTFRRSIIGHTGG